MLKVFFLILCHCRPLRLLSWEERKSVRAQMEERLTGKVNAMEDEMDEVDVKEKEKEKEEEEKSEFG